MCHKVALKELPAVLTLRRSFSKEDAQFFQKQSPDVRSGLFSCQNYFLVLTCALFTERTAHSQQANPVDDEYKFFAEKIRRFAAELHALEIDLKIIHDRALICIDNDIEHDLAAPFVDVNQ